MFFSELSGLEYPMRNISIIFAYLLFKNYKNALIFETIMGLIELIHSLGYDLVLKGSLDVPRGVFIFQDRKGIPWVMKMILSNVR